MENASTVAVIHGFNKLLEISPGFVLFKSPVLSLGARKQSHINYVVSADKLKTSMHKKMGNAKSNNKLEELTQKRKKKLSSYNFVKELSSVNKLNDNVDLSFTCHDL
jgi:hypothetical protein